MWENQSLFLPAVFISCMVCMSVWWAEKAFADFLISLFGILISSVLWMIARKKMQQTSQLENKVLLRIEIFLALLGTI